MADCFILCLWKNNVKEEVYLHGKYWLDPEEPTAFDWCCNGGDVWNHLNDPTAAFASCEQDCAYLYCYYNKWGTYISDYILNYGALLLTATFYFLLVPEDQSGDFGIYFYNYWSVLGLLVLKIALQVWYLKSPKYDTATDAHDRQMHYDTKTYRMVLRRLDVLFGHDITNTMRWFLPFFYERGCPEDMKIDTMQLLDTIIDRDIFGHDIAKMIWN